MKKLDKNQENLKNKFDEICAKLNKKPKFYEKLFGGNPDSKLQFDGVYVHSLPGRGKTMLMKDFYDKVSIEKSYFHFNEFMYQIHYNNHEVRKSKDKSQYSNKDLFISLKKVIKNSKLICFDEFQVDDIADAMLLERIFTYFIENKIFVVATSNTKPEDLYKNGIQREVFMRFVRHVIIDKFQVIDFYSEVDYRLIHHQNIEKRYFVVKNEEKEFGLMLNSLIDGRKMLSKNLEIWGRKIKIDRFIENIAIFDFEDLCQKSLSASDYKVICKGFELIILLNLPKFSGESKNEIKRFKLFIDEIYENKTALIILAQEGANDLYMNEKEKMANSRVTSRLNEIKSDLYFNNSKYIKNVN